MERFDLVLCTRCDKKISEVLGANVDFKALDDIGKKQIIDVVKFSILARPQSFSSERQRIKKSRHLKLSGNRDQSTMFTGENTKVTEGGNEFQLQDQ